ncbi:hypothetical protein [Nocardiopsis sp. LDBS1602]|uniref:hypothetical protein n=1 Tax=Nocardiopsis sp. LDBS1602 TaxID=3109597 RepID=UPI002DBEAC11|nr:hypothetical protein [Nocardiopsis sp. LDBS1602]MEC3891137.1 hypothetical protein [Nocardiopsis sp. LDBS1602]
MGTNRALGVGIEVGDAITAEQGVPAHVDDVAQEEGISRSTLLRRLGGPRGSLDEAVRAWGVDPGAPSGSGPGGGGRNPPHRCALAERTDHGGSILMHFLTRPIQEAVPEIEVLDSEQVCDVFATMFPHAVALPASEGSNE